ncbi:MAG TPA: hypothetical protein VGG79_17445 [Roseiarcus sp.]|jgi:hypothetical protein
MAREPEKSARETGKAKSETTAGSRSGGNDEAAGAKSSAPETVEQLKTQHRDLKATLAKRSEAGAEPSTIVKEFAVAWLPHMAVEYEILVPALNDAGVDEEQIAAIAIQKDIINLLLADLLRDESGQFGQAKLEALAKQFDALLAGADNGLFAIVSAAESSIPGLNAQMKARYDRTKQRFANMDDAIGEAMVMLAPRRLSVPSGSRQNRREFEMSRYSNERGRDDQGRFASDDERGYSRTSRGSGRDRDEQGRFMGEGGHSSRGRYQDDEDRRYSRSGPERDENGRFMSEGGHSSRGRYQDDEDRRYSRGGPERDENGRFMSEGGSRSRGRNDDEDERYGGRSMSRERDDEGRFTRRSGSSEGRGQGGWSGDSEGHSEASRRGWDNPRHGESGWYGDSEGHSQASRRGWDNPRHGESGWYGDSEGHSEASRRGWEHGHEGDYRSRSSRNDDDDRRYESRRSDDRDERGDGGRGGHGGWSGDPEGHSEAARRGWQNRR